MAELPTNKSPMGHDESLKIACLLSNWYSGATVLTLLLDSHSQIVSHGEAFFGLGENQTHLCSCGRQMRSCPHFQEVAQHLKLDDIFDLDRFTLIPRLSRNRFLNRALLNNRFSSPLRNRFIAGWPRSRIALERFLSDHRKLMANALRKTGASIYLDGTKSIRRAEFLINDPHGEVSLLLLVRDPRGFVNSFLKAPAEKRRNPTVQLAAEIWNTYIVEYDRLTHRYPQVPSLVVRYEDICNQTEATIDTICGFLGVSYEPLPSQVAGAEHHLLGNKIRTTFDGTLRHDLSWQDRLSRKDLDVISSVSGHLMRRFGYYDECRFPNRATSESPAKADRT